MVKDALENAARYYLSCEGARCSQLPLTNRSVAGFNYDMAQGVEYQIDLTRPEATAYAICAGMERRWPEPEVAHRHQ